MNEKIYSEYVDSLDLSLYKESWKYVSCSDFLDSLVTVNQSKNLNVSFDDDAQGITILDPNFVKVAKSLKNSLDVSQGTLDHFMVGSSLLKQSHSPLLEANFSLSTSMVLSFSKDNSVSDVVPLTINIPSLKDSLLASHYRLGICLEPGEKIILHIRPNQRYPVLLNLLIDYYVPEGASLEVIWDQYQLEGKIALFHNINQKTDSELSFFSIVEGGDLSRHDYNIFLDGEAITSNFNGLAVLNGESRLHQLLELHHTKMGCDSSQLFKVVLNDKALSEFSGLVKVYPGAHKTNSEQLNPNLMLSDSARVLSRPQLKIEADDVQCAHGSTVGQLDLDELHYLRSRGISEEEAQFLLLRGFVADVTRNITDQSLGLELTDRIMKGSSFSG